MRIRYVNPILIISPPEKLLSSEGSDLRRALFSLKQVFQEDKDLVHAFVALGGLNCLVRVGNCADQNYQNYILRALGQVRSLDSAAYFDSELIESLFPLRSCSMWTA